MVFPNLLHSENTILAPLDDKNSLQTRGCLCIFHVGFLVVIRWVQGCVGNCLLFYHLFLKIPQVRRTDAPAVFPLHAPLERRVQLFPALRNCLPPCYIVRWHMFFLPVRRVSGYGGRWSSGGQFYVFAAFSLSCRPNMHVGPWCCRQVYFGPWCFNFPFIIVFLI